MPFTLAHPAAVVPLRRFELPLSALVIGSMAPDFPYFLHSATDHHYAHSWAGLFFFCLPAGWLVLWLWHRVLKLPLLSLLPAAHRERWSAVSGDFRFGPLRQSLRISAALLVGACTHLVWDSFTHANGWTVRHWPLLRVPLVEHSGSTLFVFKALQHGSTIVGLGLLIFWYRQWLREAPAQNPEIAAKSRWLLWMSFAAGLMAAICAYLATVSFAGVGWIQPFVRVFVVRGVAILGVEMLLFSVLWHLQNRRAGAS